MTAPTPDAERVQGEVTAAVRRGGEAGPLAYTQAMTDPTVPHVWQHVTTNILATALDVEEIAEAMARRATPQYWSDEHRDMLLTLNPDEVRVDEILDEMRQGQIARFRIQAADFRAEILGSAS